MSPYIFILYDKSLKLDGAIAANYAIQQLKKGADLIKKLFIIKIVLYWKTKLENQLNEFTKMATTKRALHILT